jgi:polysaccharide export outer membrane protein
MKLYCWLCFILALLFFSSCASRKNYQVNYIANVTDSVIPVKNKMTSPRIMVNDILSIRVYSMSIDPSTDIPYNIPESAANQNTNGVGVGFLVDQAGEIEYPRIGKIKAEGLTKEELAESIKLRLQDQLKQPSVMIRFLNFRVSVLGEVNGPGTFTVATERVTVLEALGLAGDITEFGKRDNIKVMRETVDGQREIGTINLTNSDMFNSPFFQLQQNDVVFVDQSERRQKLQNQQQLLQQIGIATGIITVLALVLNFLK